MGLVSGCKIDVVYFDIVFKDMDRFMGLVLKINC